MVLPPDCCDSHCHLSDPVFDEDRDRVVARAWRAGVREIVVIGSDPESARRARALCTASPTEGPRLHWTAGLHPHDASRWDPETRSTIVGLLDHGAVAVGETGLDYHYDNSPRGRQREAFAAQLELARERDLPVVVHSRDAEDDTLRMLADSGLAPERAVLHCFTGSRRMLDRAVQRGHHISFAGIVTFRSFPAAELVPHVPAERLLAETDAPFLAPMPHRGRRNEPAFVVETVARLAELRGVDPLDLARGTLENARRFYRLPSVGSGTFE